MYRPLFSTFLIRLIALFLITIIGLRAERISLPNFSLELPEGMACNQDKDDQTIYCTNGKEQGELFFNIILKESDERDTLELQYSHLKKPLLEKRINGGVAAPSSVVKFTKYRRINNLKWIDSLHLGSEVQEFWTRYLVTVRGSVSVGVTFGVHRDEYGNYIKIIEEIISSLKVKNFGKFGGAKLESLTKKEAKEKYAKREPSSDDNMLEEYENINDAHDARISQKKRLNKTQGSTLNFIFWVIVGLFIGGIIYQLAPRKKKEEEKNSQTNDPEKDV